MICITFDYDGRGYLCYIFNGFPEPYGMYHIVSRPFFYSGRRLIMAGVGIFTYIVQGFLQEPCLI